MAKIKVFGYDRLRVSQAEAAVPFYGKRGVLVDGIPEGVRCRLVGGERGGNKNLVVAVSSNGRHFLEVSPENVTIKS